MPCLRSPTPLVLLRPFRNPPNWRMPTSGQPSTYRASRSSCLTLTPLTNLMASTLRGAFPGNEPVACRASHGDDHFSSGVSLFEITDGLGDLAQRVDPVYDRGDLPGFDELLED